MTDFLYDYQLDALNRIKTGCILCGDTGSGKSRTAIAWYYTRNGGKISTDILPLKKNYSKSLYIITTARKRDTLEWERELEPFLLTTSDKFNKGPRVFIDSWNNIKKYTDISDAYFIFDEQRVVGKGEWVKAFYKITKQNEWILLSATPGDCWSDYIPVFVANGFYKNRTQFDREHVYYKRFSKFPQIDETKGDHGYFNTGRLIRLRNKILIDMDFNRKTVSHHEDIWCAYDVKEYKKIMRERFNYIQNCPYQSANEVCLALRKVVNSDQSRVDALLNIIKTHKRVIIFYNFDYELNILKEIDYGKDIVIAEWNGHKHQEIPTSKHWVYLVQYTAGAEGWNCIKTDTIIFYSQTYSYKQLHQACGRIDRLNTPYVDLYYYHFKSKSPIDLAISKTLKNKKEFNARKFLTV